MKKYSEEFMLYIFKPKPEPSDYTDSNTTSIALVPILKRLVTSMAYEQ